MKEILFNEPHEQVGIGRSHSDAHGRLLDLKVMLGVESEVVVGEDEMGVSGSNYELICHF